MSEDSPAGVTAGHARLAAADALLAELLELDEASRRERLARERAADPELAREAEELLALALRPDTGGLAGRVAATPLWREIARHLAPRPGIELDQRLGPWRLVRELGRGGMGVVALAERADGLYDQRAAIKLFAAGAESAEAMARFERERRILAALDHPGIGRLLDGGVDPSGRPYLVLEYIEGEPIDAWCDRLRVPVDERLRLFAQVLDAVGYAHRHLVVHRDLKPSNLLVTADGRAKLLDFGIAKLLAGEEGDASPATRTVARAFTLDWASPEQIRGEPVTTASDVYQLGLLLYELLCGRRAYRVPRTSLLEAEKAIVGREARPPSELAADGSDAARLAAECRSTHPGALARRLRGDLDAVVLRALRKRADRRYAGPAELASDLGFAARGLPVRAREGTFAYRSGRFLARHRTALAAAAVGLTLLVGWALTATFQARRLERESAQRAAMVAFLSDLFRAARPTPGEARTLSAQELIEQGVARVGSELAGQPELQVELLRVLAEVRGDIGLYGEGIPLYERALALAPADRLDRDPQLIEARRRLAELRHYVGQVESAERGLAALVDATRGARGPARVEHALALAAWGDALHSLGRWTEARRPLEDSIAIFEAELDRSHPHLVSGLRALADVERDLGALDRAGELYARSLQILEDAYGSEHAAIPWVLSGDALRLAAAGRFEEAERTQARAEGIASRQFPVEHAMRVLVLERRARLDLYRGRFADAEEHAATAVRRFGARVGEASFCFVRLALIRAEAARGRGRVEDARRFADEARFRLAAHDRRSHPFAAQAEQLLASLPAAGAIGASATRR